MVQGRRRDEARVQWISALRAKGWTYSRIAREAGVTRQAIHHALEKSSRKHIIARCRKCRKPFPAAGVLHGDDLHVACVRCLPASAPFAERVHAYRLAFGMTRAELARLSGLSDSLLNKYERCQAQPRLDKLKCLIKVFGIGLVAPDPREGMAAG
jgi:transcriptional regulator with XRE-family HTH domain